MSSMRRAIATIMLGGALTASAMASAPARAAIPEAGEPVLLAQACQANPALADAVIARLHDSLIAVMKQAKQLGYAGREQKLDPVVRGAFNLPAMARVAVGTYWTKMSVAEQKRLGEAFSRMSVATYARRFDGWSGESFEIVGQEPGPRDTLWVRTRLLRPKDEPIALNYLLRNFCQDGGWRIVDVFLAGSISEMATKRSEYTSVLRDSGVEALIAAIERKATEGGT